MSSGIVFRRADQIADIFKEGQTNTVKIHAFKASAGHACIHVTHSVRVDLNRDCTESFDPFSIHCRINVGLAYGNRDFLVHVPDEAGYQGRFSGSG